MYIRAHIQTMIPSSNVYGISIYYSFCNLKYKRNACGLICHSEIHRHHYPLHELPCTTCTVNSNEYEIYLLVYKPHVHNIRICNSHFTENVCICVR